MSYARDIDKLNAMTVDIRMLTQKVKKAQEAFRAYPAFATSVTDHAALKASERLQSCCDDQPELFSDVINITDPSSSLSLVVNMRTFLITILATAFLDGRYVEQKSKNNEGADEYKYVFVIPKWRFPERSLEIVAVVEANNLKTVYFNWKSNI